MTWFVMVYPHHTELPKDHSEHLRVPTCEPSEREFQEYLWKKGWGVRWEKGFSLLGGEAEGLWWQMWPAQEKQTNKQRWPHKSHDRGRTFWKHDWTKFRGNSLASKMDFRMITYLLGCLLLGWLSLFHHFPPPPSHSPQQIFTRSLLYADCGGGLGKRERWLEKPWKARSNSESKSTDDKTENSAVINNLKAPNLEKQILYCFVNICWIAEWGSVLWQPLSWEGTGDPKISKTQPHAFRVPAP